MEGVTKIIFRLAEYDQRFYFKHTMKHVYMIRRYWEDTNRYIWQSFVTQNVHHLFLNKIWVKFKW